MKTINRLNRAVLALACITLILTQGPVNARDREPVRIVPITANAGSTAALAPTTDSLDFKATVTGVIQSSSLGTRVNNAELEVRFPTTPDQPVVIDGTATWTSISGADSLKLTVKGTALPDPANPGFYNAKYQITITGGAGAYSSAKGLGEIEEVVMFTSQTTATATWTMKGFVVIPR